MLQKILETITREGLAGAGELVVAGVSGGADSICLLSALLELEERLGIRTAAVHVHHGIRGPEADRDEDFVRNFCGSRGVPLLVCRRDVPGLAKLRGLSLEEAGREARYECFQEALGALSGDRLAVAHNQDDNAETVLFHLLRGSGLKGLSGMDYQAPFPLRRPACPSAGLQEGKRILVRPLLDVSRAEIEAYLREREISFCQDSTNASEEYDRNRIRLHVLPEARKINGAAVANIVRAAGMLKETERFLEGRAQTWLEREGTFLPGEVRLSGEAFSAVEPALSGLILRRALERLTGSLRDVTKRHTDSIFKLMEKGTGRRISLPGGVTARNEYGILVLSGGKAGRAPKECGEEERLLFPEERWKEEEIFGKRIRYRLVWREPGQKNPENRYTKWFAYDKIKGNLSLRGRRPGDWFQAFANGGRQTVKAYMINEKIPSRERERIPLLAEGSHVLWIVDGRVSEAYRVTEECSRVLELVVFGAQAPKT